MIIIITTAIMIITPYSLNKEFRFKRQLHCILTVEIWPLPTCFIPNNIHEKISPFWLVKSSAVFFKTVQKSVNSVQKEETNQVFWLVNDQRNSQKANQIFCFQIKHTPWIAQLMVQFCSDCMIRVRSFCLTISKFFHVYY